MNPKTPQPSTLNPNPYPETLTRNSGVRDIQALVAPKPPQGVLLRGHAGLVINKLSLEADGIGEVV